jgi:PIN domain nuclease of toxin-antitoxin system
VKLLLDTHTLLWWFVDDPALPRPVEAVVDDPANVVLVSAASAWEICTKVRIGKLSSGHSLCEDFSGYLKRYHFESLAVTVEHGRLAGRIAGTHKDPFDRILAAQALIEDVPIVTNDAAFNELGAKVLWDSK